MSTLTEHIKKGLEHLVPWGQEAIRKVEVCFNDALIEAEKLEGENKKLRGFLQEAINILSIFAALKALNNTEKQDIERFKQALKESDE